MDEVCDVFTTAKSRSKLAEGLEEVGDSILRQAAGIAGCELVKDLTDSDRTDASGWLA